LLALNFFHNFDQLHIIIEGYNRVLLAELIPAEKHSIKGSPASQSQNGNQVVREFTANISADLLMA